MRALKKMQEIFTLSACLFCDIRIYLAFLEDGTFIRPGELWAHTYFVEKDAKAFINVGSVGQPRDGDTRACYVLLDDVSNHAASFMTRCARP